MKEEVEEIPTECEDGGVEQHARSAASTPLSGRCQAHPRDGGLLFADLVALSVVGECMGW